MSKRHADDDAVADAAFAAAAAASAAGASGPATGDAAAPNKRQKIEAKAKAGAALSTSSAAAAAAADTTHSGAVASSDGDSDSGADGLSADDARAVDSLLGRFAERLRRAEEADAVKDARRPKLKPDAARAGLQFGVERVHRELQHASGCAFVDRDAAVYLSACLEYLTAEVLELAGTRCKAVHTRALDGDESARSFGRERRRTIMRYEDVEPYNVDAHDIWHVFATDDQNDLNGGDDGGGVAGGGLGALLDRLAVDAPGCGHDGRGFAGAPGVGAAAPARPAAAAAATAAAATSAAAVAEGIAKTWAALTPEQAQERFPVCLYGASGAHALEVWREYRRAETTLATADPSDPLPPNARPIRSLADAAAHHARVAPADFETEIDASDDGERYADLYPLHATVLLRDRPAFDHLMRILQRTDRLAVTRDRDDRNGLRPLHLAVRCGDVYMTHALVQSLGPGDSRHWMAEKTGINQPYGDPYRDPEWEEWAENAEDDHTLYHRPWHDAVWQYDVAGGVGDALLQALRGGPQALRTKELPVYSPLRARMSANALVPLFAQSLPFVPKPVAALMAAYAMEWPAAFHTVRPAAAYDAADDSSAARLLAFASRSELLQTATCIGFHPAMLLHQTHLHALSALLRATVCDATGAAAGTAAARTGHRYGVMIGDGGGDGTGTVRRFALLHVTSPAVRGTLWRGLCDAPEVRVAKRLLVSELMPLLDRMRERKERLERKVMLPHWFGCRNDREVDDTFVAKELIAPVLWRWAKLRAQQQKQQTHQQQQQQQQQRRQRASHESKARVSTVRPPAAAAAAAAAAAGAGAAVGAMADADAAAAADAKNAAELEREGKLADADAQRVEQLVARVNALLHDVAILRMSVGVVGALWPEPAAAAAAGPRSVPPTARSLSAVATSAANHGTDSDDAPGCRYEILLVRRDGQAAPIALECSVYAQMNATEVMSSVVLRVPLRVPLSQLPAEPDGSANGAAPAAAQQPLQWLYDDADVAAHATVFARIERAPAPEGVDVDDDASWDALHFRAVNAAEQSTADALCVFFKAARARLWHVPFRSDRGWAHENVHDSDPRAAPSELVDDTPPVADAGAQYGEHGVGAALRDHNSQGAGDDGDGTEIDAADLAAVDAELLAGDAGEWLLRRTASA